MMDAKTDTKTDTTQLPQVEIFSDGAAKPNPGFAGYAAILICKGVRKEVVGGEALLSNQAAEIKAVILGLKALKKPCEVTVITDSDYVVKTMTKGWKRNANQELWEELDAACAGHQIRFKWVKGHASNKGNIGADTLAQAEAVRQSRLAQS